MASGVPSFLSVVRLLRPRQWTKNLLVLAALLFARQYVVPEQVVAALRMFLAFCLASSALYVVNDLLDRGHDRLHPVRRHRPIASGAVAVQLGVLLAPILALGALMLVRGLPAGSGLVVAGYLLLGLLYSFVLRRVVIADVLAVSVGFVLRAVGGAVCLSVEISPWLPHGPVAYVAVRGPLQLGSGYGWYTDPGDGPPDADDLRLTCTWLLDWLDTEGGRRPAQGPSLVQVAEGLRLVTWRVAQV